MARAPLILASASPRRLQLLSSAGIACEVVPSAVEENQTDGETPEQLVRRLAVAKAREVAARLHGNGDARPVLGADTLNNLRREKCPNQFLPLLIDCVSVRQLCA